LDHDEFGVFDQCLLRTLGGEQRLATWRMAMVRDVALRIPFDRDPLSAGRARRAVQGCLDGETPIGTLRKAVLLTSELVTNAVTHTPSAGELVAHCDRLRKRLRIEVRDSSPVLPQIRDGFTAGDVGGYGLRLVDRLASSWGTTATATGKSVWFELRW
jgi:hypothetical protein